MIKILSSASDGEIFMRSQESFNVSAPVSEIIANVRKNGDEALREYSAKFDKCVPKTFEVSPAEMKRAYDALDGDFRRVLDSAKANITEYHSKMKRIGFEIKRDNGVILGQKIIPLARVGLYIPGGTAAYPSTVLMNCIPARIAGVGEIIMTTPPNELGGVGDDILAAAYAAGVDRVFCVGGAQAIAALAFGTESIPKVDKIVGPGNAYVAEAKKQVFGIVAIDMIAGPSEILIIADGSCDPEFVAADMLSQAEHDKNASAVLITDSEKLSREVQSELERQLSTLPRADIARASIESNGRIILVPDIPSAIEIANRLSPEHLEICTDDALSLLPLIKNAGSVFLGKYCPEAVGDYFSGTNHTLPTGGTARFSSALSVDDFIKKTEYTCYSKEAMLADAESIALFAAREGLDAHGRSAMIRKKGVL